MPRCGSAGMPHTLVSESFRQEKDECSLGVGKGPLNFIHATELFLDHEQTGSSTLVPAQRSFRKLTFTQGSRDRAKFNRLTSQNSAAIGFSMATGLRNNALAEQFRHRCDDPSCELSQNKCGTPRRTSCTRNAGHRIGPFSLGKLNAPS